MNEILVDAVYINSSGGLVLLEYFIEEISCCHNLFFLLDERVKHLCLVGNSNVKYIKGSEKDRYKFYKKNGNNYDRILCFGNIPPNIRLRGKIFTLFQNVSLLNISKYTPLLHRPLWLLKRFYIFLNKKNTDYWIVQTNNTKHLLSKKLKISSEKIIICPFFDESKFQLMDIFQRSKREEYSYIAKYIPEKNHKMLLEAWRILAKEGLYPILNITIDNYPEKIKNLLAVAIAEGCRIKNHGFCDMTIVKQIYQRSKAVVYSSMNESFGLGMIEAMNMGCDVIGPNFDYVLSICEPSEVFEYNAKSMAEAINRYESGVSQRTITKVKNNINELIEIITN